MLLESALKTGQSQIQNKLNICSDVPGISKCVFVVMDGPPRSTIFAGGKKKVLNAYSKIKAIQWHISIADIMAL